MLHQHLPTAAEKFLGSAAHVVQVSGSTATVAVIVGWDLLVASVGDSEAYLDTGAEVIQVCFLHMVYAVAEACLVALSATRPYSPLPCPLRHQPLPACSPCFAIALSVSWCQCTVSSRQVKLPARKSC